MPSVLITGANRGIGFGFAKAYLADDWKVIATCRRPEKAAALKALGNGNLDVRKLDVTDHAAITALARDLSGQPIDLLINNAGIFGSDSHEGGGPGQRFGDLDFDTFRRVHDVNAFGVLKMVDAFTPHVAASDQKKIVVVTSGMGSLATMEPGFMAYRTSKTLVNALMRSMGAPLAAQGISTLVLSPGWVRTDMGGPDAPVSVEESVAGMKRVIAGMTLSSPATFKNYRGETVPW
jgi:NAD(P)-dependent dehydrogenase (short-subunit alcohol dehydrogenase family)